MQRCERYDRYRYVFKRTRTGFRASSCALGEAAPDAVRDFVSQTFAVIASGDLCEIASTFAFGREDLLPDVFRQIVAKLNIDAAGDLNVFKYYLERHIELDGEQHGPMTATLIESLCGDSENNWRVAEHAAVRALDSRLCLWDDSEVPLRDVPTLCEQVGEGDTTGGFVPQNDRFRNGDPPAHSAN